MSTDLVHATWAGSLGYFADQLLSPLLDDDVLATREHAVRYLHPLGPLPTLRVGRQPLGVLPVLRREPTLADPFAARLGRAAGATAADVGGGAPARASDRPSRGDEPAG